MKDNNKRSVIFVIVILIALLLIFALIRGCDKKEEPKEKLKDKDKTELVTEDVTIEDMDDYYVETPKATKVVKVEKKEQILTLNLVGEDVVFVDQDTDYTEEGAFASDTIDGTLTDKVVRTVYRITVDPITFEETKTEVKDVDTTIAGAVYEIVYTITNSNNETKTVSRRVVVNILNYVELSLNGSKVVTVELGDTYLEEGVNAYETINGVTNEMTVETKYYEYNELTGAQTEVTALDTNKIVEYIINYKAVDSDGLEHTITRTIKVVDTTAPTITAKDEYKFRMDVIGGEVDLKTLYTVEDEDLNLTITSEIKNLEDNSVVDAISLAKEGQYMVTVNAKDSSNNSTTITFDVVVGEDVTAPEVVITSEDIVNTDTSKNEVSITLAATDDYAEADVIKLYYAFAEMDTTVDDLSKDAPIYRDQNDSLTWTEVTDNEINYEYDATTATDKALLVKAEDEAGNYSIYNYNTKQD